MYDTYNYPGVTNQVFIEPDTYMELATHPNITSCKMSHGDVSTHLQVSLDPRIDHSKFRVYSGFGQQLGPIVLCGASGVIDGLAAFYPKTVVRLMELSEKRPVDQVTLDEVHKLQYAVSRAEGFIEKTGIIGIREGIVRIVGMGGVDGGRLPLSGRLQEDVWKSLRSSLLSDIEKIEPYNLMALDANRLLDQTDGPFYPSAVPAQTEGRMSASNRSRAVRACDRCKKRKVRCSGTQPCELCLRAESRCAYFAPYNRGRLPPILRRRQISSPDQGAVSQHSPMTPSYDHSPGSVSAVDANASQEPPQDEPEHVPTQILAPEPPLPVSPDPSQTDLQGHYVGSASGVSFLLRVQNRLQHTSSNFTFGDAPLPDFDPTFCVMISRKETQALVQRFFDFTVPVDRFLHRPTIEAWLEEFHDTMGAMKPSESAPAQRALLWIIFAMAEDTLIPKPGVAITEKSMRHFLSAQYQLSKERGTVSLTSVQAHLCQCLWLLSQSRMNHCWTLFGTTARLALAIGLNRTRHVDLTNACTPIEVEIRRRTFWNAYCLDNYLSVAFGRPRIFHDDDIDQELPSCLDDPNIYGDQNKVPTSDGLSLMFAPVAYIKLSRIISKILRDLYSIRPPSTADRCAFTAEYSKSLKAWRADTSFFLDGQNINTAMLIPIFGRQRNVLNLAYWHTIVLTHRPFLLSNFTQLQHNSYGREMHKDETSQNIKECLDAAMNIVNTVNNLIQSSMMFQAFWFTSYFAFSASVVLYVYTIQSKSSHVEVYQEYLTAATRCQNQLYDMVEESSLAARYCAVLEELRKEATQPFGQDRGLEIAGFNCDVASTEGEIVRALNGDPNIAQIATFGNLPGGGSNFDFNSNLGNPLADFSSWVQFESMAVLGCSTLGE
ncbi:hypothetical protein O988_04180 [Pseudogymnoascus sp. VKM F-3808]|nr:hypothetical protein O988_04180 [Pseudogymnoascus sp. VKM F-3808]